MKIYGVAILAACYLAGQLAGQVLGYAMGTGGNVGGVGFGMLLLVLVHDRLGKTEPPSGETRSGILFWSSMYIPIVIAMAATQNVRAAVTGGWVAVWAGAGATTLCFFLVPLLSRSFKKKADGTG